MKKMTTEEFHKQLEQNTIENAEERMKHFNIIANAKSEYQAATLKYDRLEREAQDLLRGQRAIWEQAQRDFDTTVKGLHQAKSDAGQRLNLAKTMETNRWAQVNNKIQSDRHNIFEAYRQSGGQLMDDSEELLHPSFSTKKDDK